MSISKSKINIVFQNLYPKFPVKIIKLANTIILINTYLHTTTGCSLNIVFFFLKVVIFLNSASSAAALVFDLPSGGPSVKSSVHTLTQSLEYISKSWKNTIFHEHSVLKQFSSLKSGYRIITNIWTRPVFSGPLLSGLIFGLALSP